VSSRTGEAGCKLLYYARLLSKEMLARVAREKKKKGKRKGARTRNEGMGSDQV